MSKVRTIVEWVFGDIVNYCSFLDYKKTLKVGLSVAGKMYIVCALLTNARFEHRQLFERTSLITARLLLMMKIEIA